MDASTTWSRRRVIAVAAASGGALVLGGVAAPTAAGAAPDGPATLGLRRRDWTPLVGRRIVVDSPAGRVRATVVGVEDLPAAPAGDQRCFSVELRVGRGPALDGPCSFTVPGRGVTTLFVSAVDRGIRFRSSQIVVNSPIS